MSTLQALTDAFAELERRADAATEAAPGDRLVSVPARHHLRAPLVAASVVVTLAVAGVAAVTSSSGRGRTPAAGSQALASDSRSSVSTAASTSTSTFTIPPNAADLARRFRVVLDGSATFTVTDSVAPAEVKAPPAPPSTGSAVRVPATADKNGAAIAGTLTSGGVTGGFDLQIFRDNQGGPAWCDDPAASRCTITTLADGRSLAVEREPLPNASNGVTYEVNLVRADGVEFLMHVSNEQSPKGAGAVLAAQPPLTIAQMTAIVTSDRW